MYDGFSEVYDSLMDDYDYDAWASYYASLIGAEPGQRIAECACGTGSLTVRLAGKGLRMTGIDLSASMLRQAEKKAREWGVGAEFIRQDMKSLSLTYRADAVLATCDGVNYLTSREDVLAFFRAAYAVLKPGGKLCFDCSSRYKLAEKMGNGFFGEERDGLTLLWRNRYSESSQIQTMDVTFFVREEDGRYRRFREVHRQRAHDEQELLWWLGEAGFTDARSFGGYEQRPVRPEDERIHYLAVKPGEASVRRFTI